MIARKNPEMEVGRNSSLYFAIGIINMLLITNILLEYKTYETSSLVLDTISMEAEYEDDIPITTINPQPPPPPPLTITEKVIVVDDIEEITESIIESTESGQEDVIESRIVAVADVKVVKVEEDVEVPFAAIESVPIFPGCKGGSKEEARKCFQMKIQEHIQKNFTYPDLAKELRIQGKVFVIFIIDNKGNITNIQSRGPDKILEKEAERIISLLPTMIPGKQRGKPVRMPYSVPIVFQYVESEN